MELATNLIFVAAVFEIGTFVASMQSWSAKPEISIKVTYVVLANFFGGMFCILYCQQSQAEG